RRLDRAFLLPGVSRLPAVPADAGDQGDRERDVRPALDAPDERFFRLLDDDGAGGLEGVLPDAGADIRAPGIVKFLDIAFGTRRSLLDFAPVLRLFGDRQRN